MSITRLQQARQMYAMGQRVGRIAFGGGGSYVSGGGSGQYQGGSAAPGSAEAAPGEADLVIRVLRIITKRMEIIQLLPIQVAM